jgi:hypothetical protein
VTDQTPITSAVLPLAEIRTTGVGHIRVPEYWIDKFSHGHECSDWLNKTADGETMEIDCKPDNDTDAILFAAMLFFDRFIVYEVRGIWPDAKEWRPSITQSDTRETNVWHYDGPQTQDYPDCAEPRVAKGRLIVTLAFPCDTQGQTVTVPWDGPYAGMPVQAPAGWMTAFFNRRVWHRGDRRGAHRGLFYTGLGV